MLVDPAAVYALAERDDTLGALVKEAIGVIERALDDQGEENVALSFNGGKDCTVLVHILAAVLDHRAQSGHQPNGTSSVARRRIPTIYIPCRSSFAEMENFIASCVDTYALELFKSTLPDGLPITNMKTALAAYKEHHPHMTSIFVGTRRNDPHGGSLDFVNPTDPDWPQFLRVHPIINWSYSSVWQFLRHLEVPYCHLYDEGYTSLGSTYNTFRNPALRVDAPDGSCTWKPAYELQDDSLERAGRGGPNDNIPISNGNDDAKSTASL
ncbi:adenine nucleotide alpha hydrolases-like protein [Auricularia subglabra TFB-10046 SS5]|nr:adenine nucleotide alpha hydrolases-like protein [Auricularia subglabra TFB-10046 SS5]